jgi:hypothetical protein
MTVVAGFLKEVYEDRFTAQYKTEVVGIRRLEKTSRGVTSRVGGHYVDFPIVTQRSQSIGYRLENEALQAAGNAQYTDVHIPLRYGYFRGELTGQVLRLAEKDYQAFASAMRKEMDIAKESVVKDSNRIFYGDGDGKLARVDASTGPLGTVSVYDPSNLAPGMIVDIRDVAGALATGGDSRTITSVVEEADGTGTVTFSGATDIVVVANDDYLMREDNYASGTEREPQGLGKIVATSGTLFNVDPTTYPSWKGVVEDEGGALAEASMIKTCDRTRRNGGTTSVIFTGLGVRRAYFNLLVADRQFQNTKTFDGGFIGLPFNYGKEIPVVEDLDAPRNIMWFVDEKRLTIYQESDWHFMNEDGNTLKYVSGKDNWEYLLRKYWEFGTDQRGAHAQLINITEA